MPSRSPEPSRAPAPALASEATPTPGADDAEGDHRRAGGWTARLMGLADRRPSSPRARRVLAALAMVVFLAVSIPSLGALREGQALRPAVLPLLILVTTPLTVLANSAEYRVMGAVNGHRIAWRDAAQLTVLATVANLLPLPGGVVVRTQALRRQGSSTTRALGANLAAGLAWIACGALAVGALLLARAGSRLLGAGLVLGAVALIAVVATLLRRADPGRWATHLGHLLAIETGIVAVCATRLWLAFTLIGFAAEPVQAVTISGSVIVAAAVGIFPAGLGLREALAGALAVAVDMPANRAVAATAADRVAAQIGLALIAGTLALVHRGVPAVDREALEDPALRPVDLP